MRRGAGFFVVKSMPFYCMTKVWHETLANWLRDKNRVYLYPMIKE